MEADPRLDYERDRIARAIEEAGEFDPDRPHFLWFLLAEVVTFDEAHHAAGFAALREAVAGSAAAEDEDVALLLADLPAASDIRLAVPD